jgi:hypothetical protein
VEEMMEIVEEMMEIVEEMMEIVEEMMEIVEEMKSKTNKSNIVVFRTTTLPLLFIIYSI